MSGCVAYGCNNRRKKCPPGVTFHRFPKKELIRKAWIVAVKREDFFPSYYSQLCSEHFLPSDFETCSTLKTLLKPDAVPSIFKGYPKHFQKYEDDIEDEEDDSDGFLDENGLLSYPLQNTDTYIEEEPFAPSDPVQDPENVLNSIFNVLQDEKSIPNSKYLYSSKSSLTPTPSPALKLHASPVDPAVSLAVAALLTPPASVPEADEDRDFNDALIAYHNIQNAGVIPDGAKDAAMSFILVESTKGPNKRRLEEFEMVMDSCRKRIKMLQQTRRRHRLMIESLKAKIQELETCHSSDEDVYEDVSEEEIYAELSRYQDEIDSE